MLRKVSGIVLHFAAESAEKIVGVVGVKQEKKRSNTHELILVELGNGMTVFCILAKATVGQCSLSFIT